MMMPEGTGKPLRTFLAIDPPEDVLRKIDAIQTALKRAVQGDIAWTRPEGIHLTLKFFGDVLAENLAGIADAVRAETVAAAPLALSVRGVGVFPDLKRPRVIWLGMEGDVVRLGVLRDSLEDAFAQLGFAPENRPFRAHLTLGRIRTTRGLAGLGEAVAAGAKTEAGSFRASSLTLFRSELLPTGARYTVLDTFSLGR